MILAISDRWSSERSSLLVKPISELDLELAAPGQKLNAARRLAGEVVLNRSVIIISPM